MKNIVIHYLGGSGGFFMYYYLLASDSNIFANIREIKLGPSKRLLDACFYRQFHQHPQQLNTWKHTEIWPSFEQHTVSDDRQMFLCCNDLQYEHVSGTVHELDTSNMVVINPYIADRKKWLRIQIAKRCKGFVDVPTDISPQAFFRHYKQAYQQCPGHSRIDSADYSFDFLRFLQDPLEREKLCDRLNIVINPRMEAYLAHYLACHGDFFNTLK